MTDQAASTILSAPVSTLNTACLKRMIEAGLAWFERHYQIVNDLNVYPVPDGDTGTNMLLTLREAYQRMSESKASGVSGRALALADGAVNGSKGNSGTLLSQMFDGFAKALGDRHEIDAAGLATGFREAVQLAYQALQNPVEGTILTVAREIAEEVEAASKTTADLKQILEHIVDRGLLSVARTPDLLPKLKQAGVVDSGGRGLVYFFEGMLRVARGEALTLPASLKVSPAAPAPAAANAGLRDVLKANDERGYGYDVQYIVRGSGLDVAQIRRDIAAMGDSMVVVGDATRVKVHIHVHDPGVPISYGIKLGTISEVVVENMQDQFEDYVEQRGEADPVAPAAVRPVSQIDVGTDDIAVIAVAAGSGLTTVFKDTGVASVVSGGQSANPSVGDFLGAMESFSTDKFILLPNNKNVVLTAELAAKRAAEQGKQVQVIPTTTIPQGVAAMYAYTPHQGLEGVAEAMRHSAQQITTGEITLATRSVTLDGVEVSEGHYIGLVNGKLVVADGELRQLMRGVLEHMNAHQAEIVTLYYGAEVTEAEAHTLAGWLGEEFNTDGLPEFVVHYGGQPFYQFIMSVE